MILWALSFVTLLAAPVFAAQGSLVTPEQALSDPNQEARAQNLAREIRCVVCENEPVALSSAQIALDMRKAIRERITAGDSDAQVRRFFAERYGEFVLLRPRLGLDTLALWGTPLALLLMGGAGLYWVSRRKEIGPEIAPELQDDEVRAALKEYQLSDLND
ncbi:cytochrome c-type biogenesis protein [Candidatus Phycosocius spiralis]|nr:cytochrome c-type biogenesis protein [Candidatus Phycosocius spiralis]